MGVGADVRGAFFDGVFADSAIKAVTERFFDFDPTILSQSEAGRLRWQQEINYVFLKVTTRTEDRVMQRDIRVQVDVQYVRRADPRGNNYTKVLDFMELLDSKIEDTMGFNWDGSVSAWTRGQQQPVVTQGIIMNEPVNRAVFTYLGLKKV